MIIIIIRKKTDYETKYYSLHFVISKYEIIKMYSLCAVFNIGVLLIRIHLH
jgi:hypothetical protein